MTNPEAQQLIAIASHGAALVAFALLTGILLVGGNRRGAPLILIVACAVTAAWGGAVMIAANEGLARTPPELLLETARSAAWIAFLWRLLDNTVAHARTFVPALLRLGLPVVIVALAAGDLWSTYHPGAPGTGTPDQLASFMLIARLAPPIIALVLIENLARNLAISVHWWARFLFIGVGGIFAFDLLLYSEATLFRRVNVELYAVRGVVDAVAVPLMAVAFARNPSFEVSLHVSRQVVFHSMTLAGSGLYLIVMALAGYYLRDFGGTWGTFLQVLFLSVGAAGALLGVSSGRFRSSLKNFVNRNFFSYKYDYRHEWLQFIRLVSAQESLLPLHDRVIQALANIADSPAGAIWVLRDDAYHCTAAWNTPLIKTGTRLDPAVAERIEAAPGIIPLAAPAADGADDAPAVPDFLLQVPRAWIAVPLVHRHRILGFVVLATPRAPRRLDAEDRDLLSTAGLQAASYIAEEEAGRALGDARQLELFNQRFAFVVHDIKNLVSQLSLILSNADRHADNPEFQRDVIETVRHSVGRMKHLLEQLSVARRQAEAGAQAELETAAFDLAGLVRRDWSPGPAADRRLRLAFAAGLDLPARGAAEVVAQVIRHVVQNALEAAGAEGAVEIGLAAADGFARLTVGDDGPGMTAEFIRDKLFRPFSTTKKSGYGIGAYQARELIRRMGGRLEVASTPGIGTVVTIELPLAGSAATAQRQVEKA